jgi:hypothetical protein
MISKKFFGLGLGSVALATLLTTGCSSMSFGTYGVVPPEEGQKGVIAAWENKAANVKCGKNSYPVYKDKDRDEDHDCIVISRKSKQKPVYDKDLVNKYPCKGDKEFLAYVESRKDLVFCFHYKRMNQKPNPKKFY